MIEILLKPIAQAVVFFYRFNRRYLSMPLYKAMLGGYGKKVRFRSPAELSGLKNVYMEDYSNIQPGLRMISYTGKLIMKKHSGAAVGLTVVTGNHQRVPGSFHKPGGVSNRETDIEQDVIVAEDAWLGANVTLCAGVTIGRGATIGAGSVVRENIPPYAQAYGNPAQVVGYTFTPEQIVEHEKTLYPEDERISYDVLESNFEAFYGKRGNNSSGRSGIRYYKQQEYDKVFMDVLHVNSDNILYSEYKLTEGWDSVGHMSLLVAMENTFGISMSPEDFLKFHSYKQGISVLKKHGISFEDSAPIEFTKTFFDFVPYKDSIAILTKDASYSYAELEEISKQLSKILKDHKLTLLLAKNTIGSVACYCGCIKNHVPIAILDAHKDTDFIQNIIHKYRPEYLILPTADSGNYDGEDIGNVYDYSIKHIEETTYNINKDLQLLLTTSGSTGSPKFVRLTTENIKSNAESIVQYLELDCNERPITSLPMYYSYGISILNSHFAVGATVLLTEESVASPEFWKLAKEQNATSVSGVPYTYDMFRQMKVMDMDIPSLKTFTQAGGKMSKDNVAFFAEKCKEKGCKLIVMYGQTEASPRMSYLPFDKAIEKSDSIGIPIPNVELSVNEDGELICKGSNVYQGYAESYADLAKGDEVHGVLYTGDMARKDEDGYFYITGRKKRFVKVYGNRIGLDELEQMVSSKFGKVVCVGVDDHITIYSENKSLEEQNVVSFVSEKMKINQTAFRYAYIESFPYNDTGKLQYNQLEVIQ